MNKNYFYIGLEPVKRKNFWIVTIYIKTIGNDKALIDSENSFKTKRDAKLFISGWLEFLECHKRI
jgi:hypothetical protein